MAVPVGIDLGTSNTVVAAVVRGVVTTLGDSEGQCILPSVVSMHPNGSVLVGRAAVDRRLIDAPNTIYSVKRLIGRPWDSPEVQQARARLPFELREGPKASTLVVARGEQLTLPEISAFVLRQAKAMAEAALGTSVESAVITVPANFNDLQRAATKTAGQLAGLNVLRILNEPTAAALAYGQPEKVRERVAVFDLGGGTFDVSVLDLVDNVFEVLATAGDSALGGDDIDIVMAERMVEDLLHRHHFDATTMPAGFARLRILGEQMKCALSSSEQHQIDVDDLVPGDRGTTVTWHFRMTRPELEWASLAIVERTFKVCQRALDSAGLVPSQIDRVILVGGATRMPMVGRKVEQFFGRKPVVRINPDEVVALGAAIQADQLDRSQNRAERPSMAPQISEQSIVVRPSAPPNLGLPDLPIIVAPSTVPPPPASVPIPDLPRPSVRPRTSTRPGRREFELGDTIQGPLPALPSPPRAGATKPPPLPSSAPPQPPPAPRRSPNPAAATTTAIRRAAKARAPLLIDVTPLSLSVETAGGFCDVIIEANTPIPCDRTRSFTTAKDGQTAVQVRVAQGEGSRFSENTFLGEVELSGIAVAPRGAIVIAVTFEIDANGILNVRARNVRTGNETAARIQLHGAQVDPADLEAMRARQAAHPIAPQGAPR
jgi:molecular chaperone DnaK